MKRGFRTWLFLAMAFIQACGGGGGGGESGSTPIVTSSVVSVPNEGTTAYGSWKASVSATEKTLSPSQAIHVAGTLTLNRDFISNFANSGNTVDKFVMLVTAERIFDADGWMRLSSDEGMSTLLTPSGIPIQGGVQGAITNRFGYPFKTPIDELVELPSSSLSSSGVLSFTAQPSLPADVPPGLYRLRLDFGVKTAKGRYLDLNANSLGSRPFMPTVGSYIYSNLIPISGTHISGRSINAQALQARMPWTILHNYNSNGYQGVVADEDNSRFGLSQGSLIHDEVVLPLYGNDDKYVRSYNLEPSFPVDMIDSRANLPWDWTRGELSLEITAPDGTRTVQGPTPIVAKSSNYYIGPTTNNPAFTAWKPKMYGRHTVKLTGWIADTSGRRYEGGGTYHFWIAKRMTMATATFQGNAYPVGYKYGRDIGFAPPMPADVEITATLYPNSDASQARTVTSSGKATMGGIFGVPQGMKQLPLDAPGEYHAKILAKYTDTGGHLWVCVMRHAGVVYPTNSPIVARGKKLYDVNKKYVAQGSTGREGYVDASGNKHLEHVSFPYNQGDLLLMATGDNKSLNKIEPVLIYENKGETPAWDTKLNGIGTTNLFTRTSNGLSPHMFPEYITDREYYYGAAARPGFMSRFLVADSNTRAPYWATSPNSFGGQHGASSNGDLPGDLYRFIGGVVKRPAGQTAAYAGYLASGAMLPQGSNNNRVVAPGSEDIIGPQGTKARFFLVGYRPGMALEEGASWKPVVQVDPLLPANISLTLTFPDGRQKTTGGVAVEGSWAGPEAYILDQPGVYRYQLSASWTDSNAQVFTGKMPGLPDAGGEFYVVSKTRPSNASGLIVDLPNQSVFSFLLPSDKLKVSGRSTADKVHYALIMPGAVLAQGEVAVVNGSYTIELDPGEMNRTTPIYDILNYVTGKPQLGKILHLSLLAEEKAADGTRFWDFRRVVARGTTILSAK